MFEHVIYDTLGTAWSEVEAELPDDWRIRGVIRNSQGWVAMARGKPEALDEWHWRAPEERGRGETPELALRGLAAKLRERAG